MKDKGVTHLSVVDSDHTNGRVEEMTAQANNVQERLPSHSLGDELLNFFSFQTSDRRLAHYVTTD